MLLDFIIFEDKLEARCNRIYIETNLEKAGLLKFEKEIKILITNCFDDDYQFENDDLINCIINSGAYGTVQNSLNNQMLKDGNKTNRIIKNRVKMLHGLVFPSLKNMKSKYTYLNKFPFLLPFAWIHRGVIKFIFEHSEFVKIIKMPFNKKGMKETDKVLKKVGKLADNYVVVPVNNQNEFQGMIQLNQTGAFIWQQLEAGKNEDEILSLMLEKYEISLEKAKEDITLFIEKLRKDNLIDE